MMTTTAPASASSAPVIGRLGESAGPKEPPRDIDGVATVGSHAPSTSGPAPMMLGRRAAGQWDLSTTFGLSDAGVHGSSTARAGSGSSVELAARLGVDRLQLAAVAGQDEASADEV